MALVAAKCTMCGSSIKVDESQEKGVYNVADGAIWSLIGEEERKAEAAIREKAEIEKKKAERKKFWDDLMG